MKDLKKEFCLVISNFVKEHMNEIVDKPKVLGFESYDQMVASISETVEDAFWALTELMHWGMGYSYDRNFIVDYADDDRNYHIYKIVDSDGIERVFRFDGSPYETSGELLIVELRKVKKVIEVEVYEEV